MDDKLFTKIDEDLRAWRLKLNYMFEDRRALYSEIVASFLKHGADKGVYVPRELRYFNYALQQKWVSPTDATVFEWRIIPTVVEGPIRVHAIGDDDG